MALLVRLFGVAIVVMGLVFLTNSKALKQYIAFWKQDKKIQIGGMIALLFGIVFLMAAAQCRLTWLINILGIWSIIKGVVLLTFKKKKLYGYFDWWLNKPDSVMRVISVIVLIFGILLIYAA
jgi:hypothetical protein